MAVDFDTTLAAAVESAFGVSVTVSRSASAGGTYSASAGTISAAATDPVTILADEQATNRFVRGVGGGGGQKGVDMDEVVYNVRVATIEATALGTIREGDVITRGSISRQVVAVSMQADRTILRVVCRTEKRGR